MATYVLVHGAFTGGWYWREFASLLRGEGHEVYTPTRTGLGERVHLARPEVNLDTHIQDIINVIEYEDLTSVILAGHSSGGMVITGVADRVPERIFHLDYIDAMVPLDGESAREATGNLSGPPGQTSDWLMMPPPIPEALDARETAARARWTPQPTGIGEQKIKLGRPVDEGSFSRTYIRATGPGAPPAMAFPASRTRDNPAWRYFELPCGHNVHRELPQDLAAILLQLA